jgi:hypothetical protein
MSCERSKFFVDRKIGLARSFFPVEKHGCKVSQIRALKLRASTSRVPRV